MPFLSQPEADSSLPGREPWGLGMSRLCNYKTVGVNVVQLNPPGSSVWEELAASGRLRKAPQRG